MRHSPSSEAYKSKLGIFLQTTAPLKKVFRSDAEICGCLFDLSGSGVRLQNRVVEQEGWIVIKIKLYAASRQRQTTKVYMTKIFEGKTFLNIKNKGEKGS